MSVTTPASSTSTRVRVLQMAMHHRARSALQPGVGQLGEERASEERRMAAAPPVVGEDHRSVSGRERLEEPCDGFRLHQRVVHRAEGHALHLAAEGGQGQAQRSDGTLAGVGVLEDRRAGGLGASGFVVLSRGDHHHHRIAPSADEGAHHGSHEGASAGVQEGLGRAHARGRAGAGDHARDARMPGDVVTGAWCPPPGPPAPEGPDAQAPPPFARSGCAPGPVIRRRPRRSDGRSRQVLQEGRRREAGAVLLVQRLRCGPGSHGGAGCRRSGGGRRGTAGTRCP